MKNVQKHIIHKVNVEVNVPDLPMARRIYNNISGLLHSSILPEIELQLNAVIAEQEYYRADSFKIDLIFGSESEMEKSAAPAISEEVKKRLRESLQRNMPGIDLMHADNEEKPIENQTPAQKKWEVFIAFLQTGRLPWYAASIDLLKEEDLDDLISTGNKQHSEMLKTVLSQNSLVAVRLVKQFPVSFILLLIEKLFSVHTQSYWERFIKITSSLDSIEKREAEETFVLKILKLIPSDDKPAIKHEIEDYFGKNLSVTDAGLSKKQEQALKEIIPEANKKDDAKKRKLISFEEQDGMYVQNAGLILLQPFLQYFFKELDLLREDNFKDETSQQIAIHLLHYLATEKEQPFEYDLLFEKYLCGMVSNEPIERFIQLTEKMKEEAGHLLRAVIHHWKILKNTSPGGLREGFLQRNGKLIIDSQHKLIIENNAIDILLEKLPWSYSIITFPWMEQVLYVDWRVG